MMRPNAKVLTYAEQRLEETNRRRDAARSEKDLAREAFLKAEANRRDGRLPEDFSWERKRREPFVSSAEATESNQGGGDGERSETQAGATQAVEGLEDAREHRQG